MLLYFVPELANIPLTHIQQKFNWDCGISCVLMVLPDEKRKDLIRNFSEVCADEGFYKRFVIVHIPFSIALLFEAHKTNNQDSFFPLAHGV